MNAKCPECKKLIKPSNLARHRRSAHFPQPSAARYGTRFMSAREPISQNKGKDRRYDEIFPRGEGDFRFRIYRLRAGQLELIAAAPDEQHVGMALVTLHSEDEFSGDTSVGVLDTKNDPGNWIINPWTLGRTPMEISNE